MVKVIRYTLFPVPLFVREDSLFRLSYDLNPTGFIRWDDAQIYNNILFSVPFGFDQEQRWQNQVQALRFQRALRREQEARPGQRPNCLRTLMKWNLSVLRLWIEGGNLANYQQIAISYSYRDLRSNAGVKSRTQRRRNGEKSFRPVADVAPREVKRKETV